MPHNKFSQSHIKLALTSLAVLFVFMGMLTSLNDLLVPNVKQLFNLNYKESLAVQVVWFTSFFICCYPFGAIVRRSSYKKGIVLGYAISSIGNILFFLAWWLNVYWSFLVALFVLSCGVCFLQVVSNPYATLLGDQNKASQRLVILHSFFAVGTTIAPMLSAFLIDSTFSNFISTLLMPLSNSAAQHESIKIITIYAIFFITTTSLAVVTHFQPLPDLLKAERADRQNSSNIITKSAWQYPHTILGALAAFLCVGAETLSASFLINFAKKLDLGIQDSVYPLFVSFFWAGILIGRLLGPILFRIWKTCSILLVCTLICCLLLLTPIFISGIYAIIAVVAVGAFNSVMYPIIYSSAMKALPPSTATQASSIVSTAIIGGAIVPMLAALVADATRIEYAFLVGAICFAMIAIYPIYLKTNNHKLYK